MTNEDDKDATVGTKHEGHTLEFVCDEVNSYPVHVVRNGYVVVDFSSPQGEDVRETYLWCDTCDDRVDGEDIGAGYDYDITGK